jgi:5-methyltetrahydrofolate--homocysteine methyltransferase
MIKEYFPKAATTLGLSNVSFGLPNRNSVHNAFLDTAVQHGLDSAIMSVTDPMGKVLAAASEMWGPKSNTIDKFIRGFSEKVELNAVSSASGSLASKSTLSQEGQSGENKKSHTQAPEFLKNLSEIERGIFHSIVEGEKDSTVKLVTQFSQQTPEKSMELFLNVMTPAIRHLGDLFAKRVKFIPHLISAADAMKSGVAILEPLLLAARQKSGEKKGTIVFATVKGDIHDIGKNICVLMLKNFGYEVIDLGRNVDSELILSTAIEKKASVVALSALMTTTMMQMKVVIDAVKDRKLPFKVVIGGAVVTPEFARDISADGFSTDVGTVVSEMEKVIAILDATKI